MKVIFLQDMKGQGKKGQVKEVSEGYANNFLFPKKIAAPASEGAMKVLEQQKKAEDKRKEQEKLDAEELGKKLAASSVTIKAKSGADGRLFGAVSSKQVAEALAKAGLSVDKRKLVMPEPIRTLGFTEVPIKLHPEVTTKIRVQVIEE